MKFRPCIDIHNGSVKQIVGGSLLDKGDFAKENFVSDKGGEFYANLYKEMGLSGGHIILLNPSSSEYYEATKNQAINALKAYPGGLQLGGGINPYNAEEFLDAGASHVIVTSYVFKDGKFNENALRQMVSAVGKERLVLDLSSRKRDGKYFITTDRWQKFTDVALDKSVIDDLSDECDEFLVHAVDVEGKSSGIETGLVDILKDCNKACTYAGGVHSFSDLEILKSRGQGKIDVTIGSSLDMFGGNLDFNEVLSFIGDN